MTAPKDNSFGMKKQYQAKMEKAEERLELIRADLSISHPQFFELVNEKNNLETDISLYERIIQNMRNRSPMLGQPIQNTKLIFNPKN